LVLTISNAHGLTGKLAQESYQGVIQNLRGGVNTFGFQPNIGQVGSFDGKRVDDVLFFTRHSGIDLYVRGSGVSYVIRDVRGVFRDRVLHERVRAIHEVPLWEHEVGHYIRQTSDGGYIVVGTVDTRDTWVSDIYVLKLDGNGEKVWEKRFGGEYEDGGNFVMEASDGGYIIAGFLGKAITPEMHTEAYIIKLDANGNVSWQRAYTRSIGQ